jgi:phosphohistidine phosphatase SixA
VTLYLVRHAHAGSRRAWEGDQDDRPLSDRGLAQAAHLAALLSDASVGVVWSSPAVRCVQTVEGIAAAAGLAVAVEAFLGEGNDAGKAALRLVEQAAALDGDLVACSHGDLIPRAVGLLVTDGLRIDGTEGPAMCKKGSMWAIEVHGGRATTARYIPPGL